MTREHHPACQDFDPEWAAEAQRVAAAFRASKGQQYTKPQIEADHRLWLHALLPKHFRTADDRQFAPHHDEFFRWGWNIERGTLPSPSSCLWMVNRGGNKSTSAAGLAVALGARGRRKFGLVITRTIPQGDTHIRRVNSMLLASNVAQYYPGMSRPQVRELGDRSVRSSWNRTQLTTDDGWTLQSFSLLAAQRGVGLEEYRPDFIWITDVDDDGDSPGMVDSLVTALSSSVLATRSADCVVVFDQNPIHRDSVLNRILTRKTDVLSERKVIGPIPAVRQPVYAREEDRWAIKGQASWDGLPLSACEATLNVVGMDSWEREYQHNLDRPYPDAQYPMWDEKYHLVTWDRFAAYFAREMKKTYGEDWRLYDANGQPRLPSKGYTAQAQDWGNNHKHPCANAWLWQPAEGMPLNKFVFFYREMCWPSFPAIENDERAGPSAIRVGIAIQNIERAWDEESRMMWRLASHERPEIVKGYETDMPLAGRNALMFQGINTAEAREGILHTQNFLTIDPEIPHPFNVWPEGHPQAGEQLPGCPRAFWLVAKGQGELYWDYEIGEVKVKPALDERGQARTRAEYPAFRKPDTAQGAEKKDSPKIFDDMVDCGRAIAGKLFPGIQPLTKEERLALKVNRRFPPDQMPEEQRAQEAWVTSRQYWARAIANEEDKAPSYGGALGEM